MNRNKEKKIEDSRYRYWRNNDKYGLVSLDGEISDSGEIPTEAEKGIENLFQKNI